MAEKSGSKKNPAAKSKASAKSPATGDGAASERTDAPGVGDLSIDPALDAIDLLEADHRQVEELFDRFEHAEPGDRRAIANAICAALKVHAMIEEQVFYPAALTATGAADLLTEALVEHASAKDLIAQIELGHPDEPMFAARVRVLGEYVNHHVVEEEDELFPLCREAGLDLVALGRTLALRRQALLLGLTVSNPVLALS